MRSARFLPAALVVGALLALAACSGGSEGAAPTTTRPEVVCPNGSRPDGAPAPQPPPSGPLTDPTTRRAPRDGALDVGLLVPGTGALSFLGPAPTAAAALAAADIDAAGGVLGAPVSLHLGDSAPDVAGRAEAEVDRLLASGVDVIVGPITSGVAARVLERVRAAGGVLVSPGSSASSLDELDTGERLFRTAPTEELHGRALAELALDDGARTASLAVRDDRYGGTIADAFTSRFAAGGGDIASRVAYEPADEDLGSVVAALATDADAIVVIGLAESARLLEGLADAGELPAERLVYGTDGNLGDRLADLVDAPSSLACLRGLLPVATPDDAFAQRLRQVAPELAGAELDHAAETYDAVVLAALAAEAAGSDDPGGIAASLRSATRGGQRCRDAAACLALAGAGDDLTYVGASGPSVLDADGNRTTARLTEVAFDRDGRLRRLGERPVRR